MAREQRERFPESKNFFVRGLSPGTWQRLHVVKARLGCDNTDFLGRMLEIVEQNLSD